MGTLRNACCCCCCRCCCCSSTALLPMPRAPPLEQVLDTIDFAHWWMPGPSGLGSVFCLHRDVSPGKYDVTRQKGSTLEFHTYNCHGTVTILDSTLTIVMVFEP